MMPKMVRLFQEGLALELNNPDIAKLRIQSKINTWREDKFERSVANGTETVFVTLRFCVVRKQLKATLKPNAAGVQLPPHYYRNG